MFSWWFRNWFRSIFIYFGAQNTSFLDCQFDCVLVPQKLGSAKIKFKVISHLDFYADWSLYPFLSPPSPHLSLSLTTPSLSPLLFLLLSLQPPPLFLSPLFPLFFPLPLLWHWFKSYIATPSYLHLRVQLLSCEVNRSSYHFICIR